MFTTTTSQPVETAVDLGDLAAWLGGLDVSDPVLGMVALSATAQVIEYLQSELINRTRRLVINKFPYNGTPSYPSLSRQDIDPLRVIELPYAQLVSIESLDLHGEPFTDYEILETKPASVYIGQSYSGNAAPFLVAEYIAGYGEALQDVPEQIRVGIMQLAAFMFEHRGECDGQEALMRSGAASLLYPYRLKPVSF